jgi:MATE family multidrug resistance protein
VGRRRWSREGFGIGPEIIPTLVMAWPACLAELGWATMGVIDAIMVGHLGAATLGAAGLGNSLFFGLVVFGIGMLMGLDPLVSQAFGAGRLDDCHRTLIHGVYLSLALTPMLLGLVFLGISLLPSWGIDPAVVREVIPYLRTLAWGTLPLLLYTAFRRYLQALGLVKPPLFALLAANLVNFAGNWVLIDGHIGVPALGIEGAGWATLLSRLTLCLTLIGYTLVHGRRHATGLLGTTLGLDWGRVRSLLRLGLPAALQVTLELVAFAMTAALASRLGPASLAAHEVVFQVAGVTFLIPLGLSSAGAVRVGQAIGRGDPLAATRAGWAVVLLGTSFMAGAGAALLLLPRIILGVFTAEGAVISIGVSLLWFAALFQPFDGLQVIATGVLRGAGSTRPSMLCNLIAHWGLGLPVGYTLAFPFGWGVVGLWAGLSLGVIASGTILLVMWSLKADSLPGTVAREPPRSAGVAPATPD